ncbi:hypothetical protein [Rhizobium leucaenae]|uniref:Uncharacterized protein n=1 Tax=Rhizobium leucaenae TaxID=29450 RepID=A0A7W6ZVW2_9HYPH|nr:hypothetical protein [Rhizobium leucaenae]MBB4569723.1 hypothetical protein [Rhizobium leucaenae]MBB6299765.1 hypothetical protein [Rhizobium leucaenae]
MNTIDKIQSSDINLGLLLETLAASRNLPLVFRYDGLPMKPGYHVTEVKVGQFSALGCGANAEAWAAIVSKVSEHVRLDGSAKLTFEISDGVQPIQLYCASTPIISGGALDVELVRRSVSCKPRDRWLAEQAQAAACCGSSTAKCCG